MNASLAKSFVGLFASTKEPTLKNDISDLASHCLSMNFPGYKVTTLESHDLPMRIRPNTSSITAVQGVDIQQIQIENFLQLSELVSAPLALFLLGFEYSAEDFRFHEWRINPFDPLGWDSYGYIDFDLIDTAKIPDELSFANEPAKKHAMWYGTGSELSCYENDVEYEEFIARIDERRRNSFVETYRLFSQSENNNFFFEWLFEYEQHGNEIPFADRAGMQLVSNFYYLLEDLSDRGFFANG